MTKRINKTYKGCVTKRWQKRENERNKIRIIALIAFMLIARVALADTPVAPLIPADTQSVAEDVPLPTDWTPEELEDVQSPQEAKEERIEANLYRDEVKVPVEVKPEPVKAKPVAKKTTVKEVKIPDTVPAGKEDIINIIKAAAAKYGVSEATMLRIAKCESGLDTQAKNKTSTATGTFQFLSGTWQDGVKWRGLNWTLEDRKDIYKSADMAAWFMAKGEFERWECY